MSKKISSIIIIFFTMLYVTITLILNGYNLLEMGSIKARQVINSIKKVDIGAVLKSSDNQKVVYEEVKQDSTVVVKDSTEFEGKLYKLNIIKMSNKVKKDKLEKIYFAEREVRESIYDKTPINTGDLAKDTSSKSIENKIKVNDKETAVFNTDVKYELTEADKELILIASKKLSPLDQEKINTYLKYLSDINAKNAINLLRDRLADKDFEKIKNISLKLNKN
jgi:hypothetical protein